MSTPAVLLPSSSFEHDANSVFASALTVGDIEVQPVSGSQWRLRDRRLSGDDNQGLLGFIELTRRGSDSIAAFEVMTLSDGFDFFSFDSLQEAIVHVARKAGRGARSSGEPKEHPQDGLAWIACAT